MANDRRQERRIAWITRLGVFLLRILGWTWRIRVSHDEEVRRLRAAKQPIIFALWHGQLLPLVYHHRNEGVAVLISEHADGEIIARIATSLGFNTVRGSSSRGAARALLGLARVLGEGHDVAITPDGQYLFAINTGSTTISSAGASVSTGSFGCGVAFVSLIDPTPSRAGLP